jgi:hypothetical protein
MAASCKHDELEFLGAEKGEKWTNQYFRCRRCGAVLILSEDKLMYEVPGSRIIEKQKEK